MKKYTKEHIEEMRKKIHQNVDKAFDMLAQMEAHPDYWKGHKQPSGKKPEKSKILKEKIYYLPTCLTDFEEKPYRVFLMLRHYILRRTPSGKLLLQRRLDVRELSGNSKRKVYEAMAEEIKIRKMKQLPRIADGDLSFIPKEFGKARFG